MFARVPASSFQNPPCAPRASRRRRRTRLADSLVRRRDPHRTRSPPCQCGAASTVSVGCDSCACDQQMRTALDVVRFHASCSPSSASCSCAGEADGGRPRSVSVDGFDSTVDGAVLRQRDRGFGHPTHACECRRRALCRWWFWGGVRLEPSRCDARRRVRTSSCSSIPWRCGSRSGQRTVSMPPGHISRTLDDPAVSRRP